MYLSYGQIYLAKFPFLIFTGTGFKMAPATGQVLADLALDKTPSYDISSFNIGRFDNVVKTKALL